MSYLIGTALRSGTLARGALRYERLDDAVDAACDQLRRGYVVDAWVEGQDGGVLIGSEEIRRRCLTP